eukprot:COSAG01_NODE_2089_length_8454_cov_12.054339_10_plen_156_part_00
MFSRTTFKPVSVRAGSKLEKISNKLDDIHDDVQTGFDDLHAQLQSVQQGIEVVRQTIVNLDNASIPLIFIVEQPSPPAPQAEHAGILQRGGEFLKKLFDPNQPVQEKMRTVKGKTLSLRLVCQLTGQPVGPEYAIRNPEKVVPRLMPLLHVRPIF